MKAEFVLLEALEPRIAPAVLVNGANLLGGADNPATGETSMDEDAFTVVKVSSGQALVWFDASTEQITGISLSDGASIEVFGNVSGDIVTNLTSAGRLSDFDGDPTNGEDGNVLLANNISVTIHKTNSEEGNVGNIISGGDISKLTVEGKISGVYAGSGIFNSLSNLSQGGDFSVDVGFDVNPLDGGPVPVTSYSFLTTNYGTNLKSGASISNVYISNGINLQIFAGDGLVAGGFGGSVSNVTIDGAVIEGAGTVSYIILAGHGANGATGGNGGSIINVTEKASSQEVFLLAGNGGDGSTGSGGHGGSISGVNAQSDQSLYTVTAGYGGTGAINGGNGGNLTSNNFTGRDPATGILVSGDFTGDGFEDIVVVDAGSGQMVLMANDNGGTTFTQFGPTIDAVGVTPKTTLAADIDDDGDLDLIVSYGNSASIGIFLNDSTGLFTGSSFSTGLSPTDIAVGHFLNASRLDIAILINTSGGASVLMAQNDGAGSFTMLSTSLSLGDTKDAVDMVVANVDAGALDDLFVGYENGQIKTLIATGSTASLFQATAQVTSSTNKLSNLDVNSTTQELLAFSSAGKSLVMFSYSSGSLVAQAFSPDLTTLSGQPLVARFGGTTSGNVQVLTTQAVTSRVTEFTLQTEGYVQSSVISYEGALKTFISTNDGSGVAALTGSLSKMAYNIGGPDFTEVDLPFPGKGIVITAGAGGDATSGKGGLGGFISGLNIEAGSLLITAGDGGDSVIGAGGNGGHFTNTVTNRLSAGTELVITTGSGGTGGTLGGHGGSMTGLAISLAAGTTSDIFTGSGGNAGTGLGGNGGGANNLSVESKGGNFSLILGDGGSTATGKGGGNGGGVSNLTYTQELEPGAETTPSALEVSIIAGSGGHGGTIGKGGNGGSFATAKITVDPSNIDPDDHLDGLDGTAQVLLTAGDGADGATGGTGGSFSALTVSVTLDQKEIDPNNSDRSYIYTNFAILSVTAGDGGAGTSGSGGIGGSVTTLKTKNLTLYDWDESNPGPGLLVVAGDGGAGNLAGGKGGSLVNISATNGLASGALVRTNWLASAVLIAGAGGDGTTGVGGAGGSLTNVRVAVQASEFYDGSTFWIGGNLLASAGQGGDSTFANGGAGGSILTGAYASALVATDGVQIQDSIVLTAGNGGNGALLGGAGGSLGSFSVNTPQQAGIYGSILIAGNGGDASAENVKAKGGAGGNITSISQPKDLNSFISLLQAGNGGDSTPGLGLGGIGGNGGSVTSVKTTGFIGLPMEGITRLGVFDSSASRPDFAQGIFAGNGGQGDVADGLAGAIANIVARQIAAIGGAKLADNTFGVARSITNVKADLIGYDLNNNGIFDGPNSPSQQVPEDGFLLAQVISGIQTYNPARTALFTFTS